MHHKSEEFVSIKDLAEGWGMDRSAALKFVKKLGIDPIKRRTPDSKNQKSSVLTQSEADYVRQVREQEGYSATNPTISISEAGYFYVIQLIPEHDPNRLKFGFADNVDNRLRQHRTSAPTAEVLKSWPCKRTWEPTIIDALTTNLCRLIQNEVFECDCREEVIELADELFDLLPNPTESPDLSQHSPLGSIYN